MEMEKYHMKKLQVKELGQSVHLFVQLYPLSLCNFMSATFLLFGILLVLETSVLFVMS